MKRRIILIGFSGSGKTYSGQILAEKFNLPLIDLDLEIQKSEKLSINDIFKNMGEKYFRNIESKLLHECGMNYVISTGGGIIENRLNRDLLKRPENYVIWLNPEWNILYNRIANSPRPLVQKLNKEQLYKLCQNRGKYYQECADVCVEDVSSLDPEILK